MNSIKLESIINAALTEIEDELGENSKFMFRGSDTDSDCINPHLMLRTYSEKLLEKYHSELQKLLREQCIDI